MRRLLLRDDGIVTKLLEMLKLGLPGMAKASRGLRRDPTHGSVYTEKPSGRQSSPVPGAAPVITSDPKWPSRRRFWSSMTTP